MNRVFNKSSSYCLAIGLTLLSFLILFALFAPLLSPHSYYETHLTVKNTPPGLTYLFGTDELGRSLFVRVGWGARISLFIGVTAALIDIAIGVFYGGFAALFGGKVEEVLMRFTDLLSSIPNMLVVTLLSVVLERGIFTLILAMSLTGWVNMARLMRAEILSLKEQDFVLAAQMIGCSKRRILMKHLIPNCLGTIISTLTLTIPQAIFTEAFLSFLGLGVRAPIASWGSMASDGLSALTFYPWRLFFPAAFISLTMLSFNLIGNGLSDRLNPRLQR